MGRSQESCVEHEGFPVELNHKLRIDTATCRGFCAWLPWRLYERRQDMLEQGCGATSNLFSQDVLAQTFRCPGILAIAMWGRRCQTPTLLPLTWQVTPSSSKKTPCVMASAVARSIRPCIASAAWRARVQTPSEQRWSTPYRWRQASRAFGLAMGCRLWYRHHRRVFLCVRWFHLMWRPQVCAGFGACRVEVQPERM